MTKGNYISFCSKRAFNILDETLKQEILTKLHKNYYITIKDKNFYILNSKNIKYIEKNPHILSVKSIGSSRALNINDSPSNVFEIFGFKRLNNI